MKYNKGIVLVIKSIIAILLVALLAKFIAIEDPVETSQNTAIVQTKTVKPAKVQKPKKEYPKILNPVLIDDKKISRIRMQIEKKEEPTYSEWLKLVDSANKKLNYIPQPPTKFYVPYVYVNPVEHAKNKSPLVKDANTAYELALAYQITGNSKYARSAIRIINSWTYKVKEIKNEEDTPLVISSNFPSMIVAASLVEGYEKWDEKDKEQFNQFVIKKVLPVNTLEKENNWGNWGLLLVISSSTYLNDKNLFSKSIQRWKYFIEHQMNNNGDLIYEVTRNNGKGNYGIWYSHFTLQPQTLSAEIAKVNGVYLFHYVSPNGKSLQKGFNNLVKWTNEPETFPYFKGSPDELMHIRKKMNETSIAGDFPASLSYFEILATYYNNPMAKKIIVEERPMTANASFPYLTFTHGGANKID